MSFGERVKAARTSSGLGLRALADRVGVSAQALSKYERDLDVPGSRVIRALAQALAVPSDYFFRPTTVRVTEPAFRHRSSRIGVREKTQIEGRVRDWAERYAELEVLAGQPTAFRVPGFDRAVQAPADAEIVAARLRSDWNLGEDPISNLTVLLEDRGVKVGLFEAAEGFDGMTFLADGVPVVAVREGVPGDRHRFNLAHELGHLVMDVGMDDAEKAAHRFAGAFLVPASAVHRELAGLRRFTPTALPFLEHLKQKWGISIAAWAFRARDCDLMSEADLVTFVRTMKARKLWAREPGRAVPQEQPGRMEQLALRILADGRLSPSRAMELLGRPITDSAGEPAS